MNICKNSRILSIWPTYRLGALEAIIGQYLAYLSSAVYQTPTLSVKQKASWYANLFNPIRKASPF